MGKLSKRCDIQLYRVDQFLYKFLWGGYVYTRNILEIIGGLVGVFDTTFRIFIAGLVFLESAVDSVQ